MDTKTGSDVPVKRGWFRQLPVWSKVGIGLAVVLSALFCIALLVNLLAPAKEAGGMDMARPGLGMGGDESAPNADFKLNTNAPGFAEIRGQVESWRARSSTIALRPVPVAAAPAAAAASAGAPSGGIAATPFPALDTWGRQLILTADIGIEVRDVRAVYDRVQVAAMSEGAVITAAALDATTVPVSAGSRADYAHATVTLRVPQERFNAVRARLLQVASDARGKVLRDSVGSQDVTEEYVDLQSRLRHWRSQETQLLEIMRQARRIPDILSVRNQLSDVQQEIERISGRLRFLQNRVDLSTINIDISQKGKGPRPIPQPSIASTWKDSGKLIATAAVKSVRDVAYVLGVIVAALVYALPFVVIGGLAWTGVRVVRRRAEPRPAV